MAVTQQVVVHISIKGDHADLDQVEKKTTRVSDATEKASRATGFWARTFATLQKAIVSMIGVMIFWTTFITIPEALAKGFIALAIAAAKSSAEMQTQILATAGLIATFINYGPNMVESFENANKAATRLQVTFAALAAKSFASATDIMMGFQAFMARGGAAYVKDLDEAARVSALLVNVTLALTGGVQKERQIRTEIDALMAGQARAGAVMARLIKAQVGDLDAWLQRERERGTLAASLEKMFGGIAEANEKLAKTPVGLLNSIKGSAEIINNLAMQQGGLRPVVDLLEKLRNALAGTLQEMTGEGPLSPDSNKVLKMFATLSVTVEQLTTNLKLMTMALTGEKGELDSLVTMATAASGAVHALTSAFTWLGAAINVAGKYMTAFTSTSNRESLLNQAHIYAGMIATSTAALLDQQKADAKKRIIEIQQELLAALNQPVGKGTVKPPPSGEPDKQLLSAERATRALEKELMLLELSGNKFAQFLVEHNARARDLKEQYKDQNGELEKQLYTLRLILAAKIQAITRGAQEGIGIGRPGSRTEELTKVTDETLQALHRVWSKQQAQLLLESDIAINAWKAAFSAFLDGADMALIGTDNLINANQELIQSYRESTNSYSATIKYIRDLGSNYARLKYHQGELIVAQIKLRREIDKGIYSNDEVVAMEAYYKRLGEALKRTAAEAKKSTDEMKAVIRPFADAFAGFFESIIAGTETVGSAFKKMIGQMISAIGDMIIAYGIAMMAQGFLTWNGSMIALGALYVALGGVVKGLAAMLAGGGAGGAKTTASAGGGSTSGGGSGSRTMYVTPMSREQAAQASFYTELRKSVESLNGTLASFGTKPAGVVVREGLPSSGGVLTKTQTSYLRSNPGARVDFNKTVMGET